MKSHTPSRSPPQQKAKSKGAPSGEAHHSKIPKSLLSSGSKVSKQYPLVKINFEMHTPVLGPGKAPAGKEGKATAVSGSTVLNTIKNGISPMRYVNEAAKSGGSHYFAHEKKTLSTVRRGATTERLNTSVSGFSAEMNQSCSMMAGQNSVTIATIENDAPHHHSMSIDCHEHGTTVPKLRLKQKKASCGSINVPEHYR
jgi:hypothetical protein